MFGSLSIGDVSQDAHLIVNKDGCEPGEVRLAILNHDEGQTAYIVVELDTLRRVTASEELD